MISFHSRVFSNNGNYCFRQFLNFVYINCTKLFQLFGYSRTNSIILFCFAFCSEFPSSASLPSGLKVNVNKRCGSPSLQDVKNEISKKRHCIANADQSRLEGEDSCLNEKNYEDGQLGLIVKPVETIFDSSREVKMLKTTMP